MKILIRILLVVLIFPLMLIGRTAFDLYKYQNDYVLRSTEMHDIEAIERFSNGLKYKTVIDSNYKDTDFKEFDKFLNYLETAYSDVFEKCNAKRVNKYNLVLKLKGEDSSLSPVLLTAHYDVVGVKNENNWEYPPFSGYFDADYIYSRGTIDDKGSVFAILEALKFVTKQNFKPKRDIYIAFSHAEETGSIEGAPSIIKYFKQNNIRFDMMLDEGGRTVNKNGKYYALIGTAEKGRLLSRITIKGTGSHASSPHENPPVLKAAKLIETFSNDKSHPYMSYDMLQYYLMTYPSYDLTTRFLISNRVFLRPLLYHLLSKNPEDNARIHSTYAVTIIEASKTANAVSSDASIMVDTRILPDFTVNDIKKRIEKIVYSYLPYEEVQIEYLSEMEPSVSKSVGSENYEKLCDIIKKTYGGIPTVPYLTLGATDARDYAEISNDAFRFLPAVLTSEESGLMHSDNERISVKNWGIMIDFYRRLINDI